MLVRSFLADLAPTPPATFIGALPPVSTPPSELPLPVRLVSPARIEIPLAPGDRVYGLGAGAVGAPTRNGQSLRLMNRDTIFFGIEGATYASFPIVWVRGSGGDLACVVVVSLAPVDVDVDDVHVVVRAVDDRDDIADVIVVDGSAADICAALRGLFGAAFVPPAWALGFHQSRWSYRSADEVARVAAEFRKTKIPLDVIHLDIHYMDEYRVFSWHPERFPAPRALHDTLDAAGVRTCAIVDPGVAVGSTMAHDELVRLDGCLKTKSGATYVGKVWPGATVFPDFARPDVSAAWSGFHRVLIDAGVSGVWNDMNDPVFRVGEVYDPLAEDVAHTDGPHRLVRNRYANDMAASTVRGFVDARPDERPFVLSRSGAPGIQRHAALWTGDNFTSWEQLREGLHMIVHLGLCGVPLSGADIGGFGGRRGKYGIVKGKPPTELYLRWLELGALMPFSRVHSVLYGPRQEPWSFSDAVTAHARTILRRRYRLLPTLLALAHEAHATGLPLWRPLWMHHDVDVAHVDVADTQVLLGRDLLVAPVLDKGARRRKVYLPAGHSWRHFTSGVVYAGGVVVDVDAALGDTPIFVRSGAALALGVSDDRHGRNAAAVLAGELIVEALLPTPLPTRTTLVLEEGHKTRGRVTVDVDVCDVSGTLCVDLNAHDDGGGYVPPQQTLTLRVPPVFARVTIDGAEGVVEHVDLAGEDRVGAVACARVPLGARSVTFT